jgi:orotate phosphoribosyltransferase
MGRQLKIPSFYAESRDDVKVLRRGMKIAPGTNVMVVDDVYTTGKSIQQVIDIVNEAQANVTSINCLINRSDNQSQFNVPVFSAFELHFRTYDAKAVPSWLKEIPITTTK